jgi:hypothetical protein
VIVLKWIVGIIIGLAIFICLEDWEVGNNDIFNFLVVIVLLLIEVVIIKG